VFLSFFIIFGTIKTVENTRQLIQSFPVSIAWFYAAIPLASAFMFLDYLLILVYGRHPLVASHEEK
jgi:TRAP-type C4-dicarboxylate transport system permease small subunit